MSDLTRLAERRLRRRGQPDLRDPEAARGRCVIESSALADTAGTYVVRVTGQNYPGREHWAAVEFAEDEPGESLVVDVTARQFDADAATPWVGTLLDWYDDVLDWFNDHIDVEVYRSVAKGLADAPVWTDAYDREDVDPGPRNYQWSDT